jgi:hypothetical protein
VVETTTSIAAAERTPSGVLREQIALGVVN